MAGRAVTDAPPDILYVITDLHLGGVPLHLHRLACAMKQRGRRVMVVSLAPGGAVAEMLIRDGIEAETCDACCGFDLRVLSRLRRMVARRRPGLVHAFLFHANQAARWAALRGAIAVERVVCEIQTVEIERRWHLWVDRLTWRWCRFTIGNSPSVVEHLRARAGIPSDRLRLVRGGVDPAALAGAAPADRAELGVLPGAPLVLWVGRLDPIKGVDVLLRAWARMKRRDARLLLAGDGPIRLALEALAGKLDLSSSVRFLGSRRDVPALLKAADVFVFPSRTEGLPNALLEAMAAGRAIVTTDAPGCRDLVDPERTGLVVQREDVSALAGAMERLVADAALRSRLGDAACWEVERHWHIRDTLAAYASLYDEIGGA